MKVANKVALITGGTKGIGAAVAILLAREGADVSIVGRYDDEEAKAVRKAISNSGRRCEVVTADCSRPDQVKGAVEETVRRLGGVDIVVHSAGGPIPGGLFEITPETWSSAFDLHVHAIFHLCRAAVPLMRAKGEGAVILISSTAGKRAVQGSFAYQVVKGALPHFGRALARELAPDNIRVNCIAPGVIRTRFHANMSEAQKKLNLEQRIPLRREGTPEQVATLILEVIRNDFITGETFTIDGGLTMRIA